MQICNYLSQIHYFLLPLLMLLACLSHSHFSLLSVSLFLKLKYLLLP